MGGGVRLIGGESGRRTNQDITPQYPVDGIVIFSNVFTINIVISLKEVGNAQLVGDHRKGCIMIAFLLSQNGYNFNLKVLQHFFPYHVFRRQWATCFGVVLDYNIRYFETN